MPKTLKNPQRRNLARNLEHMTIVFDSIHFNTITYTKDVLCARFRGKQTNFEPHYARKCQKRLKNLKNAT